MKQFIVYLGLLFLTACVSNKCIDVWGGENATLQIIGPTISMGGDIGSINLHGPFRYRSAPVIVEDQTVENKCWSTTDAFIPNEFADET